VAGDVGQAQSGGSRIIGRILPAAVRLWLRSQVEQVEQLSIDLIGRDRQILRGYLPSVAVAAQNAIYKGICVGQVQLSAEDIRVNIGQVVRGKPLKLMNGFPVMGEVAMSDADLNHSLQSALLQDGLNDFWRSLLQMPAFAEDVRRRYGAIAAEPKMTIHQPQIALSHDSLSLSFFPSVASTISETPIVLGTGLSMVDGQFLQLNHPRWLTSIEMLANEQEGDPISALNNFRWNLGKDTQLSRLSIEPSQLICCGQITVMP